MAVELDSLDLDLHGFANGLPGGFFIYEAHDAERILFANDQMASLFSCKTVDEFLDFVGGTFRGMVHRQDLQRVQNAIWEQIGATHGSDESFEQRDHVNYRIVAKDGTIRYIDEYGKLVRDTPYGDLFFVFVAELIAQDAAGFARVDRRGIIERALDQLAGFEGVVGLLDGGVGDALLADIQHGLQGVAEAAQVRALFSG